ncbi:MAG: FtsX-like permease family protein [Candidatus Thermoplasmatota archaeon]
MIVQRGTAFTGILLCAILFSLSIPLLLGIAEIPEKSFGQDILTLSQASSAEPLKEELAHGLKGVKGVEAVSAEIYSFSAIGDEPVFVRGVVLSDYIALEGAELETRDNDTWRFAVVGARLASRLGVQIGSRVVLTGSVMPRVMELEITGTYSMPSGGNDLLVPLWVGRANAGLGEGMVHTIRVRAGNMSAVAAYLESTEERLVLTQGGGVSTPINTNATSLSTEERLALRYLDAATFKASNGSYISLFVQEGAQNVQVVVGGFIVLEGALTFVGSIAVMSRVLAYRRVEIGILGAIGVTRGRIVRIVVLEAIPACALASVAGVMLGGALASMVDQMGILVVFGQPVTPVFTMHLILSMIGAMLSISLGASVASAWVHASARPERVMRESGEEVAPHLEIRGFLEAGD